VERSSLQTQRAQDKIIQLSGRGLDMVAFWRACTPVLAEAVPHYLAPCCFTLDPASRLVTSHFQEGLPEFPPEWLAAEYAGDDVNQIVDVARSSAGISTLHEATDGEPSRSPRWHANMTYGGDQEMIAALRSRSGEVWGALGLYREPDQPLFDQADKAFLRAVGSAMADGVRRGLLVGEAGDPEGPESPGLIVLDEAWAPQSWSAGAGDWLAELPGGDWSPGRLPPVVLAVAGRAARLGVHQEETLARVATRSGRWLTVHGIALESGTGPRVAVILEPAQPARITPLLMSAYGLTEREQELTRLVLHGHSTAEIAQTLFISPFTVQQHLKSVFDKTYVRSRRDLVGKVFFAHYEPRLRDNEARAATDRPLRGGPMPAEV
jgi:DNA-binding CsgD family transcriptional regulator